MATATTVSLRPASVNLSGVRAGDLNEIAFTLRVAGVAMNLTGKTLTAQARVTPLATEFIDAEIIVTDPVGGTGVMRWPGDDVRTWLGTELTLSGVWDFQLGDAGSDPTTVAAGTFVAEQDVTR